MSTADYTLLPIFFYPCRLWRRYCNNVEVIQESTSVIRAHLSYEHICHKRRSPVIRTHYCHTCTLLSHEKQICHTSTTVMREALLSYEKHICLSYDMHSIFALLFQASLIIRISKFLHHKNVFITEETILIHVFNVRPWIYLEFHVNICNTNTIQTLYFSTLGLKTINKSKALKCSLVAS